MLALAIILSAIFYRCPRGGPGGDVWRRWIGFAPGSTVASITWALASSAMIVLATGAPLWLIPAFTLAMYLGEMVRYMQFVGEDGVNVPMASLLGCAMLNPLLGPIYWFARKYEGRVPTYGPVIDGWTCYAELGCGFVTAVSYALVAGGLA